MTDEAIVVAHGYVTYPVIEFVVKRFDVRDIYIVYRFAKLYVPAESFSTYDTTNPWSLFYSKDIAGVEEIYYNSNSKGKVYDLKGIPQNPDNLSPGIYIINRKKVLIR